MHSCYLIYMKSKETTRHYKSISEFHRDFGLPIPLHPLISVVNYEDMGSVSHQRPAMATLDFYKISFVNGTKGTVKYGQNYFDFDQGGLVFVAPNQMISAAYPSNSLKGQIIYMHPDLIYNRNLSKKMKGYGFFSYSVAEALHLSEKEKDIIDGLFTQIKSELSSAIDIFSQDLINSYIELFLDYSNRFYTRQFITGNTINNDLLSRLEILLSDYFNNGKAIESGLPTVQFLSSQLNFSPDYLSDMLRAYTGQNTQQHIHNKVIETAKNLLASGNLTIAQVAYQLGFEHPQSFSKMFKRKINLSPMEFRQSLSFKAYRNLHQQD